MNFNSLLIITSFILLLSSGNQKISELKSIQQLPANKLYGQEDSIFNGSEFYVYLSDDELTKLGFQYNNQYRCYFHKKGTDSSFYSIETNDSLSIGELKATIKNIEKSDLPFYIYSTSDLNDPTEDAFELKNDTLIPVLFNRTNSIFNYHLTKIYWFTAHDSLFSLLPPRYAYLKEKINHVYELKSKYPDNNFVKYGFKPIGGVPFTILTPEELEHIGIQFRGKKERSEFDFHWNCGELIYSSTQTNNEISIIDTLYKKYPKDENTILPPSIQLGAYVPKKLDSLNMKRSVSWDSCVYIDFITDLNGNKLEVFNYFERNTYPVHNNIPNALFPIVFEESEKIFWMITTSTFFNSLPKHLQRPIYIEWVNTVAQDAVSKNRFKSNGKYFENGKSTYEFKEIELEPKLENNKLTVKLVSDENLILKISLLNISGIEIKQLQANKNIKKGTFTAEYDISDIISGLYLVYLCTDKGYNIQRTIISR